MGVQVEILMLLGLLSVELILNNCKESSISRTVIINYEIVKTLKDKVSAKSYKYYTKVFPCSFSNVNYVIFGACGDGHIVSLSDDYPITNSSCVIGLKNLNDSNSYTVNTMCYLALGY